jgi:hypothetical protein
MLPNVFESFPKTRPPLPAAIQEIYVEFYKLNRTGESGISAASQWLESWMHRIIAKKGARFPNAKILDFGSGTFNHFKHEKNFSVYDAIEPFEELYTGRDELKEIGSVYNCAQDISGKKYDRVLSVAVLEHLTDLPTEIATCCHLLEKNGVFQAGIPCEGELAWYLGWRFSSAISFKRTYGLDYSVLMAYEHVNKMKEIVEVLKAFFDSVRIIRSPLPFPAPHTSFYAYIEADSPKLDFASSVLELLPKPEATLHS